MRKKSTTQSSPMTFDAPASILAKIAKLQTKDMSQSDVIRNALEAFDLAGYTPEKVAHRQVSVRLPDKMKKDLLRASKKMKVSVGDLIRAAIDSMPGGKKAR